ncbi:MAG: efflux RND transporter permease subunit [Planctomycetia bacterium]|nr:efflux RND transporter permease subunit [Planctomycetia bacterium]
MTALMAFRGPIPAAFSDEIGSESQKPLAIAVVGGMTGTIVFFNLVPVLYSLSRHREPHARAGEMAH